MFLGSTPCVFRRVTQYEKVAVPCCCAVALSAAACSGSVGNAAAAVTVPLDATAVAVVAWACPNRRAHSPTACRDTAYHERDAWLQQHVAGRAAYNSFSDPHDNERRQLPIAGRQAVGPDHGGSMEGRFNQGWHQVAGREAMSGRLKAIRLHTASSGRWHRHGLVREEHQQLPKVAWDEGCQKVAQRTQRTSTSSTEHGGHQTGQLTPAKRRGQESKVRISYCRRLLLCKGVKTTIHNPIGCCCTWL